MFCLEHGVKLDGTMFDNTEAESCRDSSTEHIMAYVLDAVLDPSSRDTALTLKNICGGKIFEHNS